MWVKDYQEHAHLPCWDKKGLATWLSHLGEVAPGRTRLITRLRTTYDLRSLWALYYALYDFGDIVMMRACLLGIKERAEAHAPSQLA